MELKEFTDKVNHMYFNKAARACMDNNNIQQCDAGVLNTIDIDQAVNKNYHLLTITTVYLV